MFKKIKDWWANRWNVKPQKRETKSKYNAWFFIDGGWLFIPKGVKFIWGSGVSEDARPD